MCKPHPMAREQLRLLKRDSKGVAPFPGVAALCECLMILHRETGSLVAKQQGSTR